LYFIFWTLFFSSLISAWPRSNLSRSDFVLPLTLAAQRRSRSGLSAAIFLPSPARRCSILSFGLPLMCSAPKVPGQVFQHESVPHARAWSLQPCFPLWSGSSTPGAGSAHLRFSLAADAAVFALTPVAGYKSHPCAFLRPGFCKSFILSCLY
jgi:hypothetical protein